MKYEKATEHLARRVRAAVKSASPANGLPLKRVRMFCEGSAPTHREMDRFAAMVAETGLSSFVELPVPASAVGATGSCDGATVRVMLDYDFHADRPAVRMDAALK